MEDKKFTQENLENCWTPYVVQYFLDILNGEYNLDEARADLKSLIGSKYDLREKIEE